MLPYLFSIFGFRLPTYGLLVALALLLALALTGKLARRAGADPEKILNLGMYCAMAGIVGAKLMMILADWPEYAQDPSRIFSMATLQAAGIFYGGFLAALGVAFVYMRRFKLPVLATADLFAPGVALGHAIGRIGCFAAGCCWGVETHLPWAVTFRNPDAYELVGVPLGKPLHPTQIYESLAELAICGFLYWRSAKPHQPGALIGQYLALYSTVRFLVDFVRRHDQANPFNGPFTTAQWISLGLIAWAAAGAYRAASGKKQRAAT
ncbi:MAG: prolipoprotein diacylglyceryl transferase [Candidatus Solibacter usitatus]|nr:prolipoprotein diacylglyceryl transferase [Candidatus Solibacter usitatus]